MARKLSYRQLDKKRFDGWMLFYIQDPEDAKTIFENEMNTKDKTFIQLAYDCAVKLMEDYKKDPKTALNRWASFYKNELKAALKGENKNEVLTLF